MRKIKIIEEEKRWAERKKIKKLIARIFPKENRKQKLQKKKQPGVLYIQDIFCFDMYPLGPFDEGRFDNYKEWADTVKGKVEQFYETKEAYPNIILANDKSYDKITEFEKKQIKKGIWNGSVDSEEFDGFTAFRSDDYSLTFCIDDTMEIDTFKLVHDEEAIFESEEDSEENSK